MARKLLTITLLCTGMALAAMGCSGAKYTHIKASELPPAVKAGFDKEFPGVTIYEVKKETYSDGVVHYEIEYTDKAGKKKEVELNDQGEVLEED